MTAIALWARVAGSTSVAVTLVITLSPPRPPVRVPWPGAVTLGICAGVLLFGAITRQRPRLRPAVLPVPLVLGKLAFLGLWAAVEEVIWRRVALGELLHAGAVTALVASTVGFALTHRVRPAIHLATGGAFGTVYLSTGVLAASIAAHWTYNLLVDAFVHRLPRGGGAET